jgi:hypothetical protein
MFGHALQIKTFFHGRMKTAQPRRLRLECLAHNASPSDLFRSGYAHARSRTGPAFHQLVAFQLLQRFGNGQQADAKFFG